MPQNVTTQIQKTSLNLTRLSQIRVINIPATVGFFIIQVHSFPYNVTLSSTPNFQSKTTVKGPNIGLVSFNQNDSKFYVRSKNETRVLIVVTIYQPEGNKPNCVIK